MDLWAFDLDGTLYDDEPAKQLFIAVTNAYVGRLTGVDLAEAGALVGQLKTKYQTDHTITALSKEFAIDRDQLIVDLYLSLNLDDCELVLTDPELPTILESISSTKVVFTNSPAEFVRRILQRLGLTNCFDDIVGIQELGDFPKPHNLSFGVVARKYPEATKICLVDDRVDCTAAATIAGWMGVNFRPDENQTPRQRADGSWVISKMSELEQIQRKV